MNGLSYLSSQLLVKLKSFSYTNKNSDSIENDGIGHRFQLSSSSSKSHRVIISVTRGISNSNMDR